MTAKVLDGKAVAAKERAKSAALAADLCLSLAATALPSRIFAVKGSLSLSLVQ